MSVGCVERGNQWPRIVRPKRAWRNMSPGAISPGRPNRPGRRWCLTPRRCASSSSGTREATALRFAPRARRRLQILGRNAWRRTRREPRRAPDAGRLATGTCETRPEEIYPTVAKILLMLCCNIKLHANLQPDQYIRKELIVGSVLVAAVKIGRSRMNSGLMNHSIAIFMQR